MLHSMTRCVARAVLAMHNEQRRAAFTTKRQTLMEDIDSIDKMHRNITSTHCPVQPSAVPTLRLQMPHWSSGSRWCLTTG
jgi:hypothetical protein